MNTRRITCESDTYFTDFKRIYTNSFPVFEQRTPEQQLAAFTSELYHLDGYVENDTLIGFIAWWNFDAYLYVEHVAINPDFRGQQYGTVILSEFIKKNDKQIILEIDPLHDETASRRYRFYQSLGFLKNRYTHYHPAYRRGNKDHELLILSTKGEVEEHIYLQFKEDLKNTVMKAQE